MALGMKRRAKIELEANTKILERSLDNAKRRLRQFGTEAEKYTAMGTIGLSMPGRAKKAAREKKGGRGGAFLGGFGGGISAAITGAAMGFASDVASDMFAFEKNLVRFQIAAGKSTSEMAKLRQSILDTSLATAVASSEILAGAQTYVDLTGDVAGAERAMNSFARIAQASGASVSDVAQATAALQQSMGLKPEDIEAVFSGMITQGKKGAVSLRDFAGELASIAPQFAKFKGGSGVAAIRDMGAAFQVARQGFGSASEAATGLESLIGAIVQNAKKFEKAGVKIFEKNPKTGRKELRAFHDIVKAIGESKLMKDPTKLADAFGRKEAAQTFDMLNRNLKLYDELAEAGKDAGSVSRDLGTMMSSPVGKLEAALNKLKVVAAEALTPERVERFANAVVKAADAFATLIEAMGGTGKVLDALTFISGGSGTEAGKNAAAQALLHDKSGKKLSPEEARKRILAAARGEDPSAFKRPGLTPGSEMNLAPTKEERIEAARRAAREAGFFIPQDDPFGQTRGHNMFVPQQQLDVRALLKGFAEEIAKRPILVQLGDTSVNKQLDNSPAHRRAKR